MCRESRIMHKTNCLYSYGKEENKEHFIRV